MSKPEDNIEIIRECKGDELRIIFIDSSSEEELLYYAESRDSRGFQIKDSADPTHYSDKSRDVLYQMMVLAENIE